ncbi:sigma-70 family RNA polymerase sigma factor [Streptomyces sp. NPDC046215]|uniref:RNA polymerase sigma factor n=1 Tax=Streptomyces stramineus TaxID=173861 RepID=A0ABN1AE61_9ACTN
MRSENVAVTVVEAARAGDAAAQDELVAAYLPLVYNIVGRALDGHTDVDDVVQETMLRVINSLGGLRDPAACRSWLVAITMNQIRDHCRDGRREETPVGGLQDVGDVPDPAADFVDLTIVRLGLSGQRREVAEATRWLDEGDRDVLSLWWLEAAGELTRAEVAAALGLTPQHTAVRVQRCKAQLDVARGVVRALAATPPCRELAELTAPWDGAPSALWRKRVARHTRGCAGCGGAGSVLVPAEGLLVGLGLVPVAGALLGWWGGGTVSAEPVGHTWSPDASASADTYASPNAYASPAAESSPSTDPPPLPNEAAMPDPSISHRSPTSPTPHRRRARGKGNRTAVRAAIGTGVLALLGGGILGGSYLFADDPKSSEVTAQDAPGGPVPFGGRTPTPTGTGASQSASPSASRSASPSASRSPASATPSSPARASSAPAASPKPDSSPDRPKPKPTPPAGNAGGGGIAQQVVSLVNDERAKAGCSPLRSNPQLTTAAQRHSDDMAARDYMDHNNPDGLGPGERITNAGYRWSTYGENVAAGQSGPAAVMNSWMNSSGHRKNILNCSFKEIGVGMTSDSGGPKWTQVFGAR